PCIVFWNFNHFLVVEGWGREHVHVNDPAVGHRRVSRTEFSDSFTGVVIALEPGPEFRAGGKRAGGFASLRERLRGCGGGIAFAVGAGFLLVLPGLVVPACMQVFVDHVLIRERAAWLVPLLTAMGLAILLQWLLKLLQLGCLRRLHVALAARMAARFLQHLL